MRILASSAPPPSRSCSSMAQQSRFEVKRREVRLWACVLNVDVDGGFTAAVKKSSNDSWSGWKLLGFRTNNPDWCVYSVSSLLPTAVFWTCDVVVFFLELPLDEPPRAVKKVFRRVDDGQWHSAPEEWQLDYQVVGTVTEEKPWEPGGTPGWCLPVRHAQTKGQGTVLLLEWWMRHWMDEFVPSSNRKQL